MVSLATLAQLQLLLRFLKVKISKSLRITLKYFLKSDGEMGYLHKFFASKQTILLTKPLGGHANLVENTIGRIKKRLYAQILFEKSTHWTKMMPKVVASINKTPVKGY